jgi:hypothetical protein
VANLRSRFPREGRGGLSRRDRATNERWSERPRWPDSGRTTMHNDGRRREPAGLAGASGEGSEAVGATGGGAIAAIAGVRAAMLIGANPIAATMTLLAWRHR